MNVDSLATELDHYAVASKRIRDLIPLYVETLGGRFIGGGDNSRVGYRGVQFDFEHGGRVEILEPLRGSRFLDRFLLSGSGVHHVTFKVRDIERAISLLQDRNYGIVSMWTESKSWKEVFLSPRETNGLLIQIVEAANYPPALDGMTLEDVLSGNGWEGNGIPSPS